MVKVDKQNKEIVIYIVTDLNGNTATGRTYEEALQYIKQRKQQS